MHGLRKGTLLLVLTFLSIQAQGYGPDYADFFINSYSKSATEQWLDNDLSRRRMELAKSKGASKNDEGEDEDEDDELFQPDMLKTYQAYLHDDGTYSRNDGAGVSRLANSYPDHMYNISYINFIKMIEQFNKNAKKRYKIPDHNIASGLTVLLAGGYAAYHNRPFPKEAVRPTVEQIREVLHVSADFVSLKDDYKRSLYQEAVGMGLQLQLAQAEMARNPDPAVIAKMQQIGAKILRERLGVNPERIDFTEKGIVIR